MSNSLVQTWGNLNYVVSLGCSQTKNILEFEIIVPTFVNSVKLNLNLGIAIGAVSVFVIAFTGCTPDQQLNARSTEIAVNGISMDLGVVFADRDSYVCIPFSKLGLNANSSIETIQSSCSCAIVSWLTYSSPLGLEKGVRIEFEREDSIVQHPAVLGIEVSIKMKDGVSRKIILNMLRTLAADSQVDQT